VHGLFVRDRARLALRRGGLERGRILTGFHFRTADVAGAWIGKKAAQWLDKHYFEPVP
jgi:hypothetical protein